MDLQQRGPFPLAAEEFIILWQISCHGLDQ